LARPSEKKSASRRERRGEIQYKEYRSIEENRRQKGFTLRGKVLVKTSTMTKFRAHRED